MTAYRSAPYVFISYASVDRPRVAPIVHALCEAGVDVWIDQDAIPGGAVYAPEIVEGIEGCLAFVLMCSNASLTSSNVHQEIALAWKYRRPYLPLLLEPVTIPRALEYWLEGAQWIEVLDRGEQSWLPRLVTAIKRLTMGEDVQSDDDTTSESSPLPNVLTTFVGRSSETEEVAAQLAVHRLVTITGPGGIGKTRLAIAAAEHTTTVFGRRMTFVSLAALRDPALVLPTIASTLGVHTSSDTLLLTGIATIIGQQRYLLVLDNWEQIVEAAANVATLLALCPNLHILATSRIPLHLAGEHEFSLAPLDFPDASATSDPALLRRHAAVELFVERARAARPSFSLTATNAAAVVSICRRVDGLPLAIELAAARVKVLTPEMLLARLDNRLQLLTGGARDLPERHRTIRATIEWSYELLHAHERDLFARLAAFAGGCSLDALETLCTAMGADAFAVLDGITALVDNSLVVQRDDDIDGVRFTMLETIRDYAADRLLASGCNDAVRDAHADYFTALATEVEPNLTGPSQAQSLEQLEHEHDNMRAALSWWSGRAGHQQALNLAASLWRFWWVRGYLSEGRAWLERLLPTVPTDESITVLAHASAGLGVLAETQGDLDAAMTAFSSALSYWQQLDDQPGIAMCLDSLGNMAHGRGAFGEAADYYVQAIAICRSINDTRGTARSLVNLGWIAMVRNESERARELFGESLALLRAAGDVRAMVIVSSHLGVLEFYDGNLDRASQLVSESLELARQIGDPQSVAIALLNLGNLANFSGDPATAQARYHDAKKLFEQLGDDNHLAKVYVGLGRTELMSDRPSDAATYLQEGLVRLLAIDDAGELAECLELLAELAMQDGHTERAARLLGTADARRHEAGTPLLPVYRPAWQALVTAIRQQLGEDAMNAAWQDGAMTPPDALTQM